MKIGIIGSGSWGLALSIVLSEKNDVKLWVRRKEALEVLKSSRESPDYLKGVKIPESVFLTNDPDDFYDREVIFFAVPSKYLRGVVSTFRSCISSSALISCVKGIEVDTLSFPTDILKEEFGNSVVGVLSGPSFAEEVARKLPCAITLATEDAGLTKRIQEAISTQYFRVYAWDDVRGVELAGAYKNVIAISAGIIDGLQLGNGAKASLITRGLNEMSRLGKFIGGKVETFYGLSGAGDLILTCTGVYSRNRRLGEAVAKGIKPIDFLSSSKMVAEGYYTSVSIKKLSEKYKIELPIANEVFEILHNNKDPLQSLKDLMSRELKQEFYV